MTVNPIFQQEPLSNINATWGRYNNMYSPPDLRTSQTWPVRTAVIKSVNWSDYTCTITDSDAANQDDVVCLSPWFNYSHGHGINFCPESGSKALITKGPGLKWFILGFIAEEQLKKSNDENDTYYKDNKPDMTEGDIHISTEAGNFIFLQKSTHAIRLENTPACFIDMQSGSNYIHIGCQNILLQTKAGMITMMSDEPELIENKEGQTRARPVDVCTSGFFRSNVSDYKNFVKVDIGKVKLNNSSVPDNTIVAVNICDKVGIIIDTDGNIKTYTAGEKTEMIEKKLTVAAKTDISLKAQSNINFDASDSIISNAGVISENAGDISNNAGSIEHAVGSGNPDTSAPYPSIPDNSNNVKQKPFTITHLI